MAYKKGRKIQDVLYRRVQPEMRAELWQVLGALCNAFNNRKIDTDKFDFLSRRARRYAEARSQRWQAANATVQLDLM